VASTVMTIVPSSMTDDHELNVTWVTRLAVIPCMAFV